MDKKVDINESVIGVEEIEEENLESEVEPEPIIGVVTNCLKLSIREQPKKSADVICTVNALTELMVDLEGSTDEWLKVYNAEGIQGFCMRIYVAIR